MTAWRYSKTYEASWMEKLGAIGYNLYAYISSGQFEKDRQIWWASVSWWPGDWN